MNYNKIKLNCSGNTKRNVFYGMISKIVMLFLPFVVQTIFIRKFGVEYNRLKGVFSSILQVLNLTELGFGGVLVYSMYEPIAKDDTETVCAVLNFYKKVYIITGIIILCVGLGHFWLCFMR